MTFQFVENDKIDATSRKFIRSHVMKGKNVGKSRRRPAGIGAEKQETTTTVSASLAARPPFDNGSCDSISVRSVPRPLGDYLSCLNFPCEMEPYMKVVLHDCKQGYGGIKSS